jgi:hypothetical protein
MICVTIYLCLLERDFKPQLSIVHLDPDRQHEMCFVLYMMYGMPLPIDDTVAPGSERQHLR